MYPFNGNFGSIAGTGVGLERAVGPADVGMENGGNAVGDDNGIGEDMVLSSICDVVCVLPSSCGERISQETRKAIETIQKYRRGVNLIAIAIRPSNSLYLAVVTALLQGCHNFVTALFSGNWSPKLVYRVCLMIIEIFPRSKCR